MPFAGLKLHPDLLRGLKDLGFVRPTPIQADAIPPALAGKDILACAMTGSGKTAAFLLPILNALIGKPRGVTRALVLTPTRELAAQIVAELGGLAVHTPITGAAVIGGVGMAEQEHAFRAGTDVIVATPGRLLDHFRSAYAKLAGLEHLVLDEADRMLDMGFLPDIRRVLRHVPARRQTYFFSATLPPPIVELSREMLRSPARINLQRQSAPALGITHATYPVPQHLKLDLLLALLERGEIGNALVFTRTKHRADRIARQLAQQGVKAAQIHGDRSQGQRTAALAGFKSGKYRVLVATDIAARGIDIAELGHVVNLDLPKSADDYVHRVGRTGRMEAVGAAFTFVSPLEEEELRDIEDTLGKRLPRVVLPDFDYDVPIPARRSVTATRQTGSRGRPRRAAAGGGGGPRRKGQGAGSSRPGASRARRTSSEGTPSPPAPAPKPAPTSPGTGLGRRIRGNQGHRRPRRG